MPIHDLIEVRILNNQQPMQEYPVPVGETVTSNENVRYIEAAAGERFEILVRFLTGYRVGNAINLAYVLSLDGTVLTPITRTCGKLSICKGKLLSIYEASSERLWTNVSTTSAKTHYFTFGVVELTETSGPKTNYDQEILDNLGEIRVAVYRGGVATKAAKPHISTCPEVYEQIPAKLMPGRFLKNNVRYEDPTDASPVYATTCHPLPGKDGRENVFVFRYRTKKLLKQLGCIKGSPTPEPEHVLMLERQEEMIKEAKERNRRANLEILALRQRVAQLEVPKEVKQEDVNKKDEDDELEELAPAPKKEVIVVDLTEDD